MSQFLFDMFTIVGGIILAVWGYFVTHKKLRNKSWWFLIIAIICFFIALYNSYQRSISESKSMPLSLPNTQLTQPKDSTLQNTKINPQPIYTESKQTIPDLPIEKLIYSVQSVSSYKPEFPFAIQITIQTNVQINSPRIHIECDDTIYYNRAKFINSSNIFGRKHFFNGNLDTFYCDFPPLTPQNPLIITLFSKRKINVLNVTRIP